MTRQIQIRRGTAAEHANFTGAMGEITVDTDAKTVRVHDGATLGGIPLARAADLAEIIAGGDGVCGGISDEELDARIAGHLAGYAFAAPALPNFVNMESATISTTSFQEMIFGQLPGLDVARAMADAVLICQTPDAGYQIGEIVYAFGIGNRTNPRPFLFTDANGVRARLAVAGENFWVSHKTSGITTNITNTNWKIRFRIWY
ncbi:MAG: hypothetical protein FWF34_02300 [Alphaproteobacteria bacterium]|nr:hypothetical protein [Alphaproteobacteria bacterium]MCL2890061.1 hypothetical protein [Alphaproteobacteria bacterium]